MSSDLINLPSLRFKRRMLTALSCCLLGASMSFAQQQTPQANPPEATLPETVVEAQPETTPAPIPEPFEFPAQPASPFDGTYYSSTFAAPPVEGYNANTATTGTLFNTPLLTTPMSISVITNDLIQDQQAVRLEELIRNIPGASYDRDNLARDTFLLRGFQLQNTSFRKNGFLDTTYVPRNLANVERIEVLNGPASVLYGAAQPAGTVNFVTKKPLAESYNAVDLQAGSYDFYRTTIDSTGPINSSRNVLYRLNVAYENDNGFRDYSYLRRFFVAPVVTWVLSDDTVFTVEGEYQNYQSLFDGGLIAPNGDVGFLPFKRFLGEPSDTRRLEEFKVSAFLDHRFNDNWALRVQANATHYDAPQIRTQPQAFIPPSTLIRNISDTAVFSEQNYSFIANLAGRFDTGPFEHELAVGHETALFISDLFRSRSSGALPPFDVFNPSYLDPQSPLFTSAEFRFYEYRFGFYAQDVVSITDRLKVMGGVRYDIVDSFLARSLAFLGPNELVNPQNYYRLSPRAGVLYELVPEALTAYYSYSQSFTPPGAGARVADTSTFLPETGDMHETGMKASLFDGRLSLTAAGFYIERQNVVALVNFPFSTQIGEVRSQGAELSATGYLTDRLSLVANYTYTDARQTEDSVATRVGQRFRNVPYNVANLWSRYNIIDNCTHTLGLGLGIVHVGDRTGDLDASFLLPSYTRFDAGVFYDRGPLTAQLYLENIGDTRYFVSSLSDQQVYPGAPVTARANIGIRF